MFDGAELLASYDFDWSVVGENFPALRHGLWLTLWITVASYVAALSVGLLVTALLRSRIPMISLLARGYVRLQLGIPLFVFLFWVYYGFASATGIRLLPTQAAILALGMTGSAYMAEIYLRAIQSVDDGQWEGGSAVGLTPLTSFVHVIAPQAIRFATPPAGNVFVMLLKGASFVSVIGVADMFYVAQIESLATFTPFEMYSAAGLVLVAVTLVSAGLVALVERRWVRSGV